MHKRQHRCGLRTVFFPSNNDQNERITLNFVFATPFKFSKDETAKTMDICHTFSPSHLIEHTLIEQNNESFNKLDQKYHATIENAFTGYNTTYYVLHINDKRYIKEAVTETLNNLMKQKEIDRASMLHELEIIKHEFNDGYFSVKDNYIIKNKNDVLEEKKKKEEEEETDQTTKEKDDDQLDKELINKLFQYLEDDKKMTKFYKRNYTPENQIIAINGGDKKTYEEIITTIDDFFKDYPAKSPRVRNLLRSYNQEEINYPKNDDFYDKLFSKKYYIFPLKNKESLRTQTRVYFKIPKDKKFVFATNFLLAISNKKIATSTMLLENLRAKNKLVYGVYCSVKPIERSSKYALGFSFNTETNKVRTALSSLRNTINKIAKKGSLNLDDFKQIKQEFIKNYYTVSRYYYFSNEFQIHMSFLFSGTSHFSLEKDIRIIKDLKYEDIVNAAKFLAKSNQFTVQCFGNNLTLNDLKVFKENSYNPYCKKDLNHFFGGREKIDVYENETLFDAQNEEDEDVPVEEM